MFPFYHVCTSTSREGVKLFAITIWCLCVSSPVGLLCGGVVVGSADVGRVKFAETCGNAVWLTFGDEDIMDL